MAEQGGTGAAAAAGGAPAQAQPGRSWTDIARSIIFQMVIFYFISSYFRGSKTPPPETQGPDGKPLPMAGVNLFSRGQELVSNNNVMALYSLYWTMLKYCLFRPHFYRFVLHAI